MKRYLNYNTTLLGNEHVLNTLLTTLLKALDFRTFRLRYSGSRSTAYDKSKEDGRKMNLKVEMDSKLFSPADPMSILDFLHTFRRTYNDL